MKQKASAPIIGGVVVVLVVFLVWWGVRSFNPPDSRASGSGAKDEYIAAEAQKCKGDFSKLPPEEQTKINKACSGYGSVMIAGAWQNYVHTH